MKTPTWLWQGIALLVLIAPLSASAELTLPAEKSLYDAMFGAKTLAANLQGHTDKLKWIFIGLAFPILVGGFVFRWRKVSSSGEMMETIMVTSLLIGFIALTSPVVDQSQQMVDKAQQLGDVVASSTGFTNMEVADRIFDLRTKFEIQGSAADNSKKPEEQGFFSKLWGAIEGAVTFTWTLFTSIFKQIALWIFGAFCFLLCNIMGMGYYVADGIRYFLLHAGAVLLPVFIAALGTESFRQPGLRYILGMFGIAMWPVGWALGNLATVTMVDAFSEFVSQMCLGTLGAARLSALPGVGMVSIAAPFLAAGNILIMLLAMVFLCCWSAVVLFFAPKIIGKVIKDGAQFFGPMMGISMQTSMAAGAAGAAVGATALAAAATVATAGAAAPALAATTAAGTAGTAGTAAAGTGAGGAGVAGAVGTADAAVFTAGGGMAGGGAGAGAAAAGGHAQSAGLGAAMRSGIESFASSGPGRMAQKALSGMSHVMEQGSHLNVSDEHHGSGLQFGQITRDARSKARAAGQPKAPRTGKL